MNRGFSTVSIVVPAYNEERTIAAVVERVRAADTAGLKSEIVVVDNGTVRASGTHDVLVASDSMYADFAATQLLAGE